MKCVTYTEEHNLISRKDYAVIKQRLIKGQDKKKSRAVQLRKISFENPEFLKRSYIDRFDIETENKDTYGLCMKNMDLSEIYLEKKSKRDVYKRQTGLILELQIIRRRRYLKREAQGWYQR